MTRRRFYAPPEKFAPDGATVTLDREETRHLRDVLRLRPGDEAYVFDGDGAEYLCLVERPERGREGLLRIVRRVESARPESPLYLTLALALLKGEKFDLVVQKATELGVSRIVPVITKRADVRLREERDAGRRRARHSRLALEAAKQSGRARLPRLDEPVSLAALVGAETEGLRLMFAERAGTSLKAASLGPERNPSAVTALIGPEGGWEDEEIETARAAGWSVVTLGGRTLRAETAAITAIVLLAHLYGDLS